MSWFQSIKNALSNAFYYAKGYIFAYAAQFYLYFFAKKSFAETAWLNTREGRLLARVLSFKTYVAIAPFYEVFFKYINISDVFTCAENQAKPNPFSQLENAELNLDLFMQIASACEDLVYPQNKAARINQHGQSVSFDYIYTVISNEVENTQVEEFLKAHFTDEERDIINNYSVASNIALQRKLYLDQFIALAFAPFTLYDNFNLEYKDFFKNALITKIKDVLHASETNLKMEAIARILDDIDSYFGYFYTKIYLYKVCGVDLTLPENTQFFTSSIASIRDGEERVLSISKCIDENFDRTTLNSFQNHLKNKAKQLASGIIEPFSEEEFSSVVKNCLTPSPSRQFTDSQSITASAASAQKARTPDRIGVEPGTSPRPNINR